MYNSKVWTISEILSPLELKSDTNYDFYAKNHLPNESAKNQKKSKKSKNSKKNREKNFFSIFFFFDFLLIHWVDGFGRKNRNSYPILALVGSKFQKLFILFNYEIQEVEKLQFVCFQLGSILGLQCLSLLADWFLETEKLKFLNFLNPINRKYGQFLKFWGY